MASTGFVLLLKPRASFSVSATRKTGAVLYVPFRSASGVMVGSGLSNQGAATSAKSMLPGARVQLVDEKGFIRPEWWRFFNWLLNDKLGGVSAPSIADVASTVTTVQTAVTSTVTTITELADQAAANAAVLNTVREVAQVNGLDGADQIENPVLQRKGIY
jgi:hypothetical protein